MNNTKNPFVPVGQLISSQPMANLLTLCPYTFLLYFILKKLFNIR